MHELARMDHDAERLVPVVMAACVRDVSSDPAVLIELVTAIGAWRMVSSILHSLAVPLEDGIDSWPPDGQAPSP